MTITDEEITYWCKAPAEIKNWSKYNKISSYVEDWVGNEEKLTLTDH